MTTWEAILLGIIQGLTEFLPISSSGHLELGQYFLGFQDLQNYIFFNLVCHLGTLVAIVYMFFPQLKQSLTQQTRFLQIFLGTLPLFPLVLILKPLKAVFDQPQYLGICFLLSSALLFASSFSLRLTLSSDFSKRRWSDPLAIGLFQAVAVLPGVSRSGATISAARLLGWTKEEAIQFSFLLAIPAILGGTVLELWQIWKAPASDAAISFGQFFAGFSTSFIVGCAALWLLQRMMAQDKLIYFAWYCLGLGLFTSFYFNVLN
ncbi:undecaprenyl-diphosphate phosphatase [Candidatus Protochlamydia phocaeensis]|uniref:undecaprenyl-diphosphate phosphatase n=1 Tax=Candidatus Protochlamydia phocaeensis TaxID=1414722 RepID=UPI000839550D|nr:undecaprenyl-diphosphate phosphatase [Candidatus Protochlamydia phocaeensis]